MITRVYKYGLGRPTVGAAEVADQMHAAHRYANTLTEIERARRAAIRAAEDEHPEVAGTRAAIVWLEREHEACVAAIAEDRQSRRTRAHSRALASAKTDALGRLRRATMALRLHMALVVRPVMRPRVAYIEERASELRKAARALTPTYWGTYQLVEEAAERSRKTTPMYADPRFRSWSGDGAVSVQLQGGLTVDEAESCEDTRLRIERAHDPRVGRRGGKRRVLWARVGSEGRAPVWACWPMEMHRPLPDGAKVMRATVHRRMVGTRDVWTVDLTVRLDADTRPVGTGDVAVHIGWRRIDGGIRVATWWDGVDGGECVLPDRVQRRLDHADSIRSLRDQHMDMTRAWLVSQRDDAAWPPWLREATTSVHAWRSPRRFVALARRCLRETDCPGGIQLGMEMWRYRDQHLGDWEAAQRLSTTRYRKDVYRCFARQLATRYERVIVGDEDYSAMRRTHLEPQERDEARVGDVSRAVAQYASPGDLRACVTQAFGERVSTVSMVDMSRSCHVCGAVTTDDLAASIHAACPNGHVWDQDANAVRNMLSRERSAKGPETATARGDKPAKNEGRWARLKREKREKEAAEVAARKDGDSAAK